MTSGAFFAALAVILGAFGAHALKARLTTEMLTVFETGVRYQFYHSFALLVTGIVFSFIPGKNVKLASLFFITGIILFSGSLYLMAFLSISGISIGPAGIITPLGGLFFILGWILLFLELFKKRTT